MATHGGNLHVGELTGYVSGNNMVRGNDAPAHKVPSLPGIKHSHLIKFCNEINERPAMIDGAMGNARPAFRRVKSQAMRQSQTHDSCETSFAPPSSAACEMIRPLPKEKSTFQPPRHCRHRFKTNQQITKANESGTIEL